jgi:tetratricopeptide (TPR) repeat protein
MLLLAGGASFGWWRLRPAPPDPPLPGDIREAQVRRAIELARQGVLDEPRSAAAWGYLGMTLLAHLFDREADRCFAEAARLDPADPWWPYGRGLIALKRDPEHALDFLRQAAAAAGQSRPEDQSALRLQLAEALLERRQLDEAEGLFRKEQEREPGNARAALGLGLIALDRGDEPAATDLLTTARASPFSRKTATAQLAALARARGDGAAAAAYEKEAATLPGDPPWPDPLLDRIVRLQVGHRGREREATQLEQERRYAEAARVYLEQVEDEPTAQACMGAGLNLARVGDYDRALPLLRRAVALDPDGAQAHYTLAQAQFTRAEERWQQAPGDADAKQWLGEALEHARRAAQLKPDHAKAHLFWGLSLTYLGDPAAAVAPLRQGVACRPEDFDLQLGLGEALLESGRGEEAGPYLENARRLNPKDPRPARDLERLRHKKD